MQESSAVTLHTSKKGQTAQRISERSAAYAGIRGCAWKTVDGTFREATDYVASRAGHKDSSAIRDDFCGTEVTRSRPRRVMLPEL